MEQVMYLKPNVVIEPLIDRWYAWSHLVSPATAARNIQGRHLKIINSFIQAPHIHAAAVKNPKMLGGPFMDVPLSQVDKVKNLRDETMESTSKLLELSDAITELDQVLKDHPKGYSLETAYAKVPEALRGYVELVYDLNNNPSYRFFEPLLYNSEYYDDSLQSIVMWVTENDDRPFVLSTPRVDDEGSLHLNIPFCDEFIDEISKMKREGGLVSKVRSMVDLTEEQEAIFNTFFTDTPPPVYEKYEGDKVRMRYFGHACVLIETKGVSVLVDPLVSYYGYQHEVDRFSDMDLPDVIDYVLITHNHQDHILFETLLPLRHKIKNVIVPRSTSGSLQDPSLKLMFQQIGFSQVQELSEMECVKMKDASITGIPFIGEHSDLNIQSKLCYHMQIEDFKILFVADACNLESRLYDHIHRQVGDVDLLFLGMECDGAPLSWLYGPLLTEELSREKDSSRRLAGSNYERGKELVRTFNPKEVYVYAMGMEPWLTFISSIKYTDESNPIIASNKLIKHCHDNGMVSERLFGEKELLYVTTEEPEQIPVLVEA